MPSQLSPAIRPPLGESCAQQQFKLGEALCCTCYTKVEVAEILVHVVVIQSPLIVPLAIFAYAIYPGAVVNSQVRRNTCGKVSKSNNGYASS